MKYITNDTAGQAGAADPLDALAAKAQTIDQDATIDQGGPGTPADDATDAPPLTNQQCLMMAGQIVRDTLCAVARVTSPKETLSDVTLGHVADAVAPVLDKYGIALAGVAGDYLVEIRAVMVVVPVVLAFRAGLANEMKAKAKPEAPAYASASVVGDNEIHAGA